MVNQSDPRAENAPLDPLALAASLAPFGRSTMLPRDAYVTDSVFAWEQLHLLQGGWICVGRSEGMLNPNDQRAVSVGRAGVFLTRDQHGVLRAFANACRHRGHELLPCGAETVNRAIVVCPYHAWSYRLDGTLRMTPGYDSDTFDPTTHGLVELPCQRMARLDIRRRLRRGAADRTSS